MKLLLKFKEHLPGKSKKKPGGGPNGEDGNNSSNQAPVPAQPTASDDVGISPSQNIDPWIRAYEIFQNQQPELMADYKKHLASLQGGTATSADLSTPRSVECIVEQLLKGREDKQWHLSLLGKNVKIREQGEKLVKFLLWTDPIVKNAVSAQPYAALAWSSVSLLLPVGKGVS
jgi:ankyrin repeat domain-containing protein 50